MECQEGMSPVNTSEPEHVLYEAQQRVLKIQTKLHRWARDDPYRRFDDLYNLVCDPAFLVVAWDRVRGNKGARTAARAPHGSPVGTLVESGADREPAAGRLPG